MAFLENFFFNPVGLIALLTVIPLILIYLIKHRPKKQVFPSVQFLMKRKKEKKILSMFENFVKDPLFFIQLLVLIILSMAIAGPYLLVNSQTAAENVVIVLDASASMQTRYNGGTRFDAAKQMALDNLGDVNTIILVSEFPELLGDNLERREAERLLQVTKPKETQSNIYDSVILIDDFLKGKGKAVVISDFINTVTDKNLQDAITVIKSKGIPLELKSLNNEVRNTGIVDIDVKDEKTEVRVKNFNKEYVDIELKVNDFSRRLNLKAGESDVVSFDTPAGISEVRILPDDDFMIDNIAKISSPEKGDIKVLFITNDKGLYLYTALSLIDGVKIDIAEPPLVENFEYDVFVFKNVDKTKLLPRIVQSVSDKVQQGSSAVITTQNNFIELDYKTLLDLGSIEKKAVTRIPVEGTPSALTESVDFGSLSEFYHISAELNELATVNVNNQTEVIVGTKPLGAGTVMYYGLQEESSTFHLELLYPVFWKRILSNFVDREDIKNLNYVSGKIVDFPQSVSVTDPEGDSLTTKSLVLDQAGIYELQDRKIAVNLANELESDVNGNFASEGSNLENFAAENQGAIPKAVAQYLIIAVIILVILEVFYIKFRGDL